MQVEPSLRGTGTTLVALRPRVGWTVVVFGISLLGTGGLVLAALYAVPSSPAEASNSHIWKLEPPFKGRWASVPRRIERAVVEGHIDSVAAVCAVRVGVVVAERVAHSFKSHGHAE